MNFSFQNTFAFWGLLAIAIPLVIHLLSKSKGSIIWVGTIKWIPVTEQTRSRSIRLNEYALFLLRSVIISLLVLLIAAPVIFKESQKSDVQLVIIDTSLEPPGLVEQLLDTIDDNLHEIRYLSGIHITEDPLPSADISPDVFGVLADLNAMGEFQDVTLYTHGYLRDFRGRIPDCNFDFSLVLLPSPVLDEVLLLERQFDSDSVFQITQELDGNNLISRKRYKSVENIRGREFNLSQKSGVIIAESGFQEEVNEWLKVLETFASIEEINFTVEGVYGPEEISEINSDPSLIVWIGKSGWGKVTADNLIIYDVENLADNSSTMLQQLNSNTYRMNWEITPIRIYNEEILQEVFKVLHDGEISDQKLLDTDVRQITQEFSFKAQSAASHMISEDMAYPFWLVLILTLIAERILSKRRNQ